MCVYVYMRVVRKVVVFSYEGEDLLVLALTFAKVPRRGSRKLFCFPRKFFVACKQEAGVMNHVYLPAVRAECPQTKVGRRMRSLRVAARIRRCNSNPQPAETSFWEV